MAKEKAEEGEEEVKGGSSKMKIVIISVILLLVVGGGLVAGTLYFIKGDSEETEAQEGEDGEVVEKEKMKAPIYISMDPKFVVSFKNQNSARFMQFSLNVMSREKDVENQIKEHMPMIRSSLLMLFGGQDYKKMSTREGKAMLLSETVVDINTSLKSVLAVEELEYEVEAAYFTSFVVQ